MFRLGPAPRVDGGVIAGKQDLRHRAALEETGAGVLRIFQQVVLEALLDQRGGAADHAGQERTQASITAIAAISPPEST